MKILKIIAALAITLLLVFALSFLLDLQIIKQNWLRYALAIILNLTVLIVGAAVVWQYVKQLKKIE